MRISSNLNSGNKSRLVDKFEKGRLVLVCSGFIGAMLLSGCAGPKIAVDLLANTKRNENPIVNNSSIVTTTIDIGINNYEKIDESVKQSLEIALENANIFSKDASKPFRIDADILVASQSPMSFGSFKGKLDIRYIVYDPDDKQILDETIKTVAGSDKWSLSGAARHRRSRAVNISTNVLQFVEILQSKLEN